MSARVWVLKTFQTADHRNRNGEKAPARNWWYPIGTIALDKYPRPGDRVEFDDGQAPFGPTGFVVIKVDNFEGEHELRLAVDTGAPACEVSTTHFDDNDDGEQGPCGVPAVARVHVDPEFPDLFPTLQYRCGEHLPTQFPKPITLPSEFADAHDLYALLTGKGADDAEDREARMAEFARRFDTDGSAYPVEGFGTLDALYSRAVDLVGVLWEVRRDMVAELHAGEAAAASDGTDA